MAEDLHTTSPGAYEKTFRAHNYKIMNGLERNSVAALPYHMAVEMVERGIWEDHKQKYFVILPRIWNRSLSKSPASHPQRKIKYGIDKVVEDFTTTEPEEA